MPRCRHAAPALLLALLCAAALSGPPAPAAAAGTEGTAGTGATAPHLRDDGHIALAWLYGGTSAEYRAQVEQATGLTTISPTWWYLDPDDPGGLELDTDDELVAWAQARGLAVWPLLGNHIDPDLTDQVLRDPALRQRLVDGVVAEVRRSGVDGVNVDFENLHDRTAVLLTDLVAELAAALPDLVVSVDVTAMTDTWVLGNWSTAFDREGLGRVADYVVLMAYDQHNSLRRDGPVAGLDWVEASTEFLLRTVPPEKVVLGLPFYSRDWAEDPAARDGIDLDATLGMAAMAVRLAERSQGATYDPAAGMDLHTYVDAAGRPHRVWHEDVVSIGRKVELVERYGLAGVAAWRAGFEPAEVWTAIDAQLAAVPAPGAVAPAAAPVPAQPPPATATTRPPSTPPPGDGPGSGAVGGAVDADEPTADGPTAGGPASPSDRPATSGASPPPEAPEPAGSSRAPWVAVAAVLLAGVGVAAVRVRGSRTRR